MCVTMRLSAIYVSNGHNELLRVAREKRARLPALKLVGRGHLKTRCPSISDLRIAFRVCSNRRNTSPRAATVAARRGRKPGNGPGNVQLSAAEAEGGGVRPGM